MVVVVATLSDIESLVVAMYRVAESPAIVLVFIVHAWFAGETLLNTMVGVVEVLVSPSKVILQSFPDGRPSSLNVKV